MDKPRVLILGGCGFIGRNLVAFLVKNDLASAIRVADKVPPQVAWLNEECHKYFQDPIVDFKSANLINPESCKNAFSCDSNWDFVVNCAGETKLGQTDPIYEEGILKLSLNCAREAAKQNVKHYIELSSGKMHSSDKAPHKEDAAVEPWSFIGKWKHKVEKQLSDIPNLKFTILRLAIVYGVGDRMGLTPRLIVASIYKYLGETMKLLWNSDLKINTVHVSDVCRAIWFMCNRDDTIGQVYNVVDEADSTQGSICGILSDLFNIKVDFCGNIVSAVVDLESAADDANDKHLVPWAEVCRLDNVQNTPLTPHMDPELLLCKHLRLDGAKLKSLGFKLDVPQPTVDNVKEVFDDYVRMKVFPVSLAP
ncbi:uncharacterized protein LOC659370 [Tribolium castaneum]|uniref:NAD-dependent epimerase/dehydratase domain-containing protein n=1 Tax=Tribolium castaneum TaxID=7070 RepID=D6WAY2_TRICA|nr:PREDICTED: uncharacterized protein LOC659370 [Tribolium castaneum]EEZ97930.1 hypothetical protein TcasGA2_TC000317 [Tribolium castaneum]|eukprot:XP_008201719.1 PREDICTED: uncharacterized protein LOC659370 [Tribolium castaneum]